MGAENFNRFKIRRLVSILPGIHLRALQRLLGISFNTARYHVSFLSRAGEILCEKEGGFSRLYPKGFAKGDSASYLLLGNKSSRTILSALVDGSSLTNKQISELTGLSKSTVSERLGHFVENGIVRKVLSENERLCYVLENPNLVSKLLRDAEQTILEVATDRFIDLWNF